MRTVLHKYFGLGSVEKEQRWLNEMASRGLCLVAVGFGRYEFEDCLPGEYSLRLELLEKHAGHPESRKYIEFMEETGMEQVGSWLCWVYWRKKKADGDFELFSDNESRLRHLTRVLRLIAVIGGLNLYSGVYNLFLYFSQSHPINLLGSVNFLFALYCAVIFVKGLRKRKQLQKNLALFE